MSSRIVLGLDPGPERIGYAIITLDGHVAEWCRSGLLERGKVETMLSLTRAELVVIELPAIGRPAAVKGVASTIAVAWRLYGYAEGIEARVIMVPPNVWRAQIIGITRRKPGEQTIDRSLAQALPAHCKNLPRKLCCHERDAIAVAVAGARIEFGAKGGSDDVP